ncbi:Vitamin K-dependent gamma-carboxylase [Stieleria maiorica]|uniref:Vitamin K-dependent gamma-carboxylase n=1 Tax=Stieleria maiorica TaxID=2795974 RepID=A0A5B9MKW6_9BACT|nr:HTTM domain-containing protein [Stieleria maiorica]QEG01909.1 Vitamin K-dependent gamma-carboxylase [Stieleria maiorica]
MLSASAAHARKAFFAPHAILPLVVFRIGFGVLLSCFLVLKCLHRGVDIYYTHSDFHPKYLWFRWIPELPSEWYVTVHYLMAFLALLIAAGVFFRAAAWGFALIFTYVFLLDASYYVNHYYLTCLLSFLLASSPAGRAWSIDTYSKAEVSVATIPAWPMVVLRFQMGVVYFFAGIAKIDADWLSGVPMRMFMESRLNHELSSSFHFLPVAAAWSGMLFDLLIAPALLFNQTRWLAIGVATTFHLTNWFLFHIDFFPFLAILLTFMFLPDRIWRSLQNRILSGGQTYVGRAPRGAVTTVLTVFFAVQLLVPLRGYLIPGNATWTGEGNRFAWRMMLCDKSSTGEIFAITDSGRNKVPVVLSGMTTKAQRQRIFLFPDAIAQLCQYLRTRFGEKYGEDVAYVAEVKMSLNGRRPRYLVDPNVDLSRLEISFWHSDWILNENHGTEESIQTAP